MQGLAQHEGTTNGETPLATRQIARTLKRAQELMAHQEEIERQVAARWETAGAVEPWAAQGIAAVNIDSWGSFPFVLARVVEGGNARQKLLVRGRNRLTEQQTAKALEQEVAKEASSRKLPLPRVEVLGSGMMQWSRDRDRCLNISGTNLFKMVDNRLKTKEDVGRVAGALVQTGLTPGHTVLVHPKLLNGREA